ncbi:MAG TPA: DUF192 domain-containing protein [bacterium]|nr:DUF192 domain-containing protein [bacterium]
MIGLRILILLIAVTMASPALLDAQPERGANGLFKKGTLVLLAPGRRVVLQVEVADTAMARSRGLMDRERLAADAGMLFIFEESGRWGFWMKNTLIPLSIAFIDKTWRIVDIQDMAVAPNPREGPFTIYEARAPALYALEVRQGLFKHKGIGVGARVIFTPHE